MASPRLPPELEYAIFLLAYQTHGNQGRYLILVVKRVFEWLIPFEFNLARLSKTDPYPIKFNEATSQKYGRYVRHLMIDSDDYRPYLPFFPNVVDLAFWATYDPIYLPSLLQMPLEQLSAGNTMSSPGVFQLFANVTHLYYIPVFPADDIGIRNALYLPKLTHLCVLHRLSQDSLEIFLDRVRCPQLRVVAIWYYGHGAAKSNSFELPYRLDDKRVVSINCNSIKDWKVGARGGVDKWELAEELVAERRASTRR